MVQANLTLRLLSLFFLFLVAYRCKSVREVVTFDTEILATVTDDNNQPLDGAIVALFDNKEKFKFAVESFDFSSANQIYTSEGGQVVFKKLTPERKYWLAAYYRDIARIAGAEIDLDNDDISNELAINPRKGSVNYITIKLRPSSGIVIVYPGKTSEARIPLKVKFNGKVAGTISNTFDTPPTLADSGVFWLKLPQGPNTYAISSSDCAWSGVVTVSAGALSYLNLGPCRTGRLAFYYPDTTRADYPIFITLNSNENLPLYTTPVVDTLAVSCYTVGLYTVIKDASTYTYLARTASGKCVWIGRATVNANACTLIYLPKCGN